MASQAERTKRDRLTRRDLLRYGAAGAAAAGLWSASDLVPGASAQTGRVLRAGLDSDPPNLDPHRSSAAVDRQVFQSLFDKLVDLDANLKIVPMLATSWSISSDGTVYTLKLQQGVQFHDGTPFNAQAAVYNFNRMARPEVPVRQALGDRTDHVRDRDRRLHDPDQARPARTAR